MPTGFVRTSGTNSIPIWQGTKKDMQIVQGGFALAATGLTPGATIPAGTPGIYDEAARTFTIIGGGSLQGIASGSPTTYRLNKGSTIKVGDNIALTNGGPAFPVTAIDITNTAYDVMTVGTTLGNAAVGANVYVSSATGATAGVYNTGINGLLYDDRIVPVAGVTDSVSVVIRGTVYARRLTFANTVMLAAITALKGITWSQSK